MSIDLTGSTFFGITVSSTLTTLAYMSGFMSFYEINLSDIEYNLQLADFILTLSSLIVIILVYIILQTGFNFILNQFLLKRCERISKIKLTKMTTKQQHLAKYTLEMFYWFILVLLFSVIIFNLVPKAGEGFARSEKEYFTVSDTSNDIQLLVIRKTGEGVLVKPYSLKNKEFLNGFEIISPIKKYKKINIE